MADSSVQEILSRIEKIKRDSEKTFKEIGSQGSAVYNFCHAGHPALMKVQDQHSVKPSDIDEMFLRTIDESVTRSLKVVSNFITRKP